MDFKRLLSAVIMVGGITTCNICSAMETKGYNIKELSLKSDEMDEIFEKLFPPPRLRENSSVSTFFESAGYHHVNKYLEYGKWKKRYNKWEKSKERFITAILDGKEYLLKVTTNEISDQFCKYLHYKVSDNTVTIIRVSCSKNDSCEWLEKCIEFLKNKYSLEVIYEDEDSCCSVF